MAEHDEAEIERRAFQRGEERARAEKLQEEHNMVYEFVRDYRTILDKVYASKLTETIVNTALKVVLLAVLGAGLALVIAKQR